MQFTKGETIASRVATIRRLARWASTAIDSWLAIEAETDNDLLDPFRPYLVVSAHGHRELGLLYLNAIFETRPDTVNISAICSHLERHSCDTSAIRNDLAKHHASLKKLYIIRGGAVGHRTGACSYDETFAKAKMTLDELNDLVALGVRCGIALAEAIGLPADPPYVEPTDYLKKALRVLADPQEYVASKWP